MTVLNDFLKIRINLKQLKKEFGENLYNVEIKEPMIVHSKDLIFLINQYISNKITLQEVADWVNVVWFTELFEYNPAEEDSISSVMTILETIDEDDEWFSNGDFKKMIDCLLCNTEYEK